MTSAYSIFPAQRVRCPNGGNHEVFLLSPTALSLVQGRGKGPAFYVCFTCKFIGEVGVGPVNHGEVEDEEAPR